MSKKTIVGLISLVVSIFLIFAMLIYSKNWSFTIKMEIFAEGIGIYQLILKDKTITSYSHDYNGEILHEEVTITEQELQNLLDMANNLRATFEESNFQVFGGWKTSLFYKGKIYHRDYIHSDSKAFRELAHELVRLSPLQY